MGNELESTIDRWHDGLRELTGRLEILEAFIAELEKAANRKPFEIWNDIVWHLMQDCRRLLVVDLASRSKSVNRKGGFIGLLRGHHGTAFKRQLFGSLERFYAIYPEHVAGKFPAWVADGSNLGVLTTEQALICRFRGREILHAQRVQMVTVQPPAAGGRASGRG